MSDAYLNRAAQVVVDIDASVETAKEAFSRIHAELLNNPDKRHDSLAELFIQDLIDKTISETDDEANAETYWAAILSFLDVSWGDINRVRKAERGDTWTTGRAFVAALASHQAFIESGLAYETIMLGVEEGPEQQKLFGEMSKKEQFETAESNDKKQRVSELKSRV